MSRYVIAWPSEPIRQILLTDEDAVFLDNQGFWIYSQETKKRDIVEFKFDVSNISSEITVPNIRGLLNSWAPVWTRWLGQAEDYELIRADSVFVILKIACALKSLNIQFFLMHTGVPHHWDTSVASIACEVSKVQQVFLYAVPFDDWRLLPIIQLGNIKNRKIFDCDLMSGDLTQHVELLVNSKLNGRSVTISESAHWKSSFLYAIILNIYHSIILFKNICKRRCIELIEKFQGKIRNDWVIASDYNFGGFLNIIKRQRRFLIDYEKNQISNSQVKNIISSNRISLVIAAHNQPEANSYPEGGDYFNHLEIILSLRLKGYSGDLLYKEHPAVWHYSDIIIGLTRVGLYRSERYIENLLDLGCLLLPKNVPLSIKRNECGWYLPVTITGTIALERSLAGLHTIVTGEPWYKGLPGVIHLSDISSLECIDSRWVVPDTKLADDAKSFLVNLLRNNSLVNSPGIGTGRLVADAKKQLLFESQFQMLINQLKEADFNDEKD
jgi:hypothetical protein